MGVKFRLKLKMVFNFKRNFTLLKGSQGQLWRSNRDNPEVGNQLADGAFDSRPLSHHNSKEGTNMAKTNLRKRGILSSCVLLVIGRCLFFQNTIEAQTELTAG